ncbi:MAG TPA: hypothetical protein VL651_15195 [Bacteroidia bacterium]|jgi:hypothetical protein|nr:hypothetical protein [Bacteroidia bacterium]
MRYISSRIFFLILSTFSFFFLHAQQPFPAWVSNFGSQGQNCELKNMTRDAAGNIYATGYFTGLVNFSYGSGAANLSSNGTSMLSDIFVVKYDSTGTALWAFSVGGANTDKGAAVAVDTAGYVYVCGVINGAGSIDADPSSGTFMVTGAALNNIFVAKYNGNLLPSNPSFFKWAFRVGGTLDEEPKAIGCDSAGNVFITGFFASSNVDFDPSASTTTLSSAGAGDIFLMKVDGNLLPSSASFFK